MIFPMQDTADLRYNLVLKKKKKNRLATACTKVFMAGCIYLVILINNYPT